MNFADHKLVILATYVSKKTWILRGKSRGGKTYFFLLVLIDHVVFTSVMCFITYKAVQELQQIIRLSRIVDCNETTCHFRENFLWIIPGTN